VGCRYLPRRLLCAYAFLFLVAVLRADGPIGPTIDQRMMNEQRRQAAVAKEAARIRFNQEQGDRADAAARVEAQRQAAAQAAAEVKERDRQRQLALIEQARAEREKAGEGLMRSRGDRALLNELSELWRMVNGETQNMAWAGWSSITGSALESHDGWIRVRTPSGDICLTNFPKQIADGEMLSVKATQVGMHRYTPKTVKDNTDTGKTIRKYDCGTPCPPPLIWLANAPLRKAEEARMQAEENARLRAAEEANRADQQRFLDAQAAEVEKEQARILQLAAQYRTRQDATTQRVVIYQQQQASNGYPSFQYELGKRYLLGDGVTQNKTLARFWLNSACTNGLSEATNLLTTIENTAELITDAK